MADRDAQRQAVERVLSAASAGDPQALVANYTADVVVEYPYADPPVRVEGRDAVLARLRGALAVFRFRLHLDRLFHDGPVAVAEFHGEGEHLPTGNPYANSYVVVFTFRHDLICGQREYFNPLAAQRATASRRG